MEQILLIVPNFSEYKIFWLLSIHVHIMHDTSKKQLTNAIYMACMYYYKIILCDYLDSLGKYHLETVL